jgi:hypothetical protein
VSRSGFPHTRRHSLFVSTTLPASRRNDTPVTTEAAGFL